MQPPPSLKKTTRRPQAAGDDEEKDKERREGNRERTGVQITQKPLRTAGSSLTL